MLYVNKHSASQSVISKVPKFQFDILKCILEELSEQTIKALSSIKRIMDALQGQCEKLFEDIVQVAKRKWRRLRKQFHQEKAGEAFMGITREEKDK